MCYYSLSLRPGQFRSAKEGEDITLATHDGHAIARANSDGSIVCMMGGSEAHIAKLQLRHEYARDFERYHPHLRQLVGTSVTCRFREPSNGYSADCFVIDGIALPMIYLAPGTTFYLGAKRPSLETRLGMDDPSIALDHRETVADDTPTHERARARALGLCSIIR